MRFKLSFVNSLLFSPGGYELMELLKLPQEDRIR